MKVFRLLVLLLVLGCNQQGPGKSRSSDGHLYLRTFMWNGAYGSSLDISWIYLSGDGRILVNPQYGVDPVQWDKEEEDNNKNIGTYEEQDGTLEIRWANGKTDSWSIERKNGEVSIINGGIISEPDRMPRGYRLDGQYAASSVLPNVANTQTIVFEENGRFDMNSYGTVTTPDVTSSAENSYKGTYDISGNTLTLEFDNGDIKKSVICIWETDEERNLVINTRYFPEER